MKLRFAVFALAIIVAIPLSSCKKSPPDGQPPQVSTGQAAQSRPSPEQLQEKLENDIIENPDNPAIPAGYGTVKGKIYVEKSSGNPKGNLFIYIVDDSTLNQEEPSAIASQIVFSDNVQQGGIVDFSLSRVPTGQRRITVIWDVSAPYCVATKPVCPLSIKDKAGQSETLSIMPGSTLDNVEIALTSTP